MANFPTRLFRGVASTTLTSVYTVPADTTTIVTNIVIANTNSSATSVLVKMGAITVVPNTPVPANGIFTLDMSQVMDIAGQAIEVQGSASGVGVHISGVEVTG
ncbi:hypothetical protein FDI80_gp21 [Streptomyces phage Aaronocolus]|uniref:Uncharacterized protein n=10 Tax=Likavirus TaxID=1982880 RepID=A0A411CVH2_9CAUD|nr:hypothetical protein AVT22_gp21 [Streptomyces phage Caliburn]YP_009616446.1 hypothetical protein FDI80_gp21 [Streptomyces phage Aaronocolus]YP_009616521.1 hypothetical protein FDI81_gp23 [Streptomyces phage Hydra]ATE85201.1 hypothetical protein SEA_ESPERER_21 [Streptomyces phage Esperer]ATE85426.1 hypothetical protein SEA_OZZIE_21 [Streptomyces phage Ozzie]QAY17224.1 hypothetical protein SEA_BOVELY_21 [Streptomyces phage Bovely]QAY17297.1 hypothetical protein SEA_INDIGO_21 [Streptomyces ph